MSSVFINPDCQHKISRINMNQPCIKKDNYIRRLHFSWKVNHKWLVRCLVLYTWLPDRHLTRRPWKPVTGSLRRISTLFLEWKMSGSCSLICGYGWLWGMYGYVRRPTRHTGVGITYQSSLEALELFWELNWSVVSWRMLWQWGMCRHVRWVTSLL